MSVLPDLKDWIVIVIGLALSVPVTLLLNRVTRARGRAIAHMARGQGVLTEHGSKFVRQTIALTHNGEALPRLSVAAVTVWNAGEAVVDAGMITTVDPLRIQLRGEGVIVQAYVERQPFPACEVAILTNAEATQSLIKFNYLNPMQGAVIRILHTSVDPVVDVVGSLKGTELLSGDRLVSNKTKRIVFTRLVLMGFMLWAIAWMVLSARDKTLPGWAFPAVMFFGPAAVAFLSGIVEKKIVIPLQLRAPEEESKSAHENA